MTKEKIKFGSRSYMQPTPKNFRKLGDALLAAGGAMTMGGVLGDNKFVAIVSIIIAVVGKFLTNFFSKDDEK